MSGLDVEALLDSTANAVAAPQSSTSNRRSPNRDDRHKSERNERRDRDRHRDGSRDRDRDRKRRERSRDRDRDRDRERPRRERNGEGPNDDDARSPKSEGRSANGSMKSSRRRSRSRDGEKRHSHRDRHRDSIDVDDSYRGSGGGGGDYYRGSGRGRDRSKTPDDDRYYRPSGRSRRDRDDRGNARDRDWDRPDDRGARGRDGRRRTPSPRRDKSRSGSPQLTEDERDRRTVFVQQLAARLRTKELITFFEKIGPVKEAQIVKDRVSGRSKGVGYVEFRKEESVPLAIQLTGQKLLGIPIIAQLTEAEKNRQARNNEGSGGGGGGGAHPSGVPFHRLYVGNIHFSITEGDLQNVFEPFGELEFVQLQKEEGGRSRGYGFVQFRDPNQAKEALEKMNGFDLAGRPIRVGLGNDKFTTETTANLMQRFHGQNQPTFQGSAFSGSGGRGAHAGGTGNFDRAGGRDNDKGAGGASALDDTDVAGVNFNNYSRDALMRKLARTDQPAEPNGEDKRKAARPVTITAAAAVKPPPVNVGMASRCIVLRNMFDPAEEEGDAWIKELEDDVRAECEEKYGHVVHIALDPNTQGDIYLKFDRVQGGENAIKGLNGRFFGGRQIGAQPVVDAVYSSLFTRTKAM